MEKSTTLRRNPSREACEGEIKRILMTEVLEITTSEPQPISWTILNHFIPNPML